MSKIYSLVQSIPAPVPPSGSGSAIQSASATTSDEALARALAEASPETPRGVLQPAAPVPVRSTAIPAPAAAATTVAPAAPPGDQMVQVIEEDSPDYLPPSSDEEKLAVQVKPKAEKSDEGWKDLVLGGPVQRKSRIGQPSQIPWASTNAMESWAGMFETQQVQACKNNRETLRHSEFLMDKLTKSIEMMAVQTKAAMDTLTAQGDKMMEEAKAGREWTLKVMAVVKGGEKPPQ